MFKEEFMRIVTNVTFYLSVVAATILMMMGTFYTVPDTGKEYTFFDVAFGKDRGIISESEMTSEEIIIKGINNPYYEMFLPLLVIIPFIVGIYGDKKNSITRFQIYRTGKWRYALGKFMAVMISGGIIAMFAQVIFSMAVYRLFPNEKSEMFEMNKMFLKQQSVFCRYIMNHLGDTGLYILKFVRVFLYGAFSTVTAFALSAVIKNRYIVMTIPVVLEYMWGRFINKSTNSKMLSLRSSEIGNVFQYDLSWMLPFFIMIVIISFVFYMVCLERKCDCGEE